MRPNSSIGPLALAILVPVLIVGAVAFWPKSEEPSDQNPQAKTSDSQSQVQSDSSDSSEPRDRPSSSGSTERSRSREGRTQTIPRDPRPKVPIKPQTVRGPKEASEDELRHVVLGNGLRGRFDDSRSPWQTSIQEPRDVAFAPDGSLWVIEDESVLAIEERSFRIVLSSEAMPASPFPFRPSDVAFDSQGRLLLLNGRSLYVFLPEEGVIEEGWTLPAPDEDPYGRLSGLAVDDQGEILVGDPAGHRVWRLLASGDIEAYAGNGAPGDEGDEGPAAQARLNEPCDVAFLKDGSAVIVDRGNGALRHVRDGTIRTLAGKSGGLDSPRAVAVDQDGSVLVLESPGTFVRRVTMNGKIASALGRKVRAVRGLETTLSPDYLCNASSLAFDLDGNLLIADTGNFVVKRVPRRLLGY